jgi:hypothetical protein
MPFALYILFGAVFTIAAATCAGRLLLRALKVELDPLETWLFSLLLGASAWSTTLFALAAAGLVYKGVILAMGLAVIGLAARLPWPRLGRPPLWSLAAAPFFLLYLANAMAPELSPDGTAYHLGLVSRYYRQHSFGVFASVPYENMYAHLSQGMEMLFLSAWPFGRNSAAAMVHFAFQCALPCLIASYARRFQLGWAGSAAALLVYLTPVVGIDGISAYNGVAGAAVVFGVFYLVEIYADKSAANLLVPIGLLAGFAFAIKYTLGLAIPYAIVRVVWRTRRLQPMLIVTAAATLTAAPWLVKNAILTGNPVAPLFNAWFPNPFVTPVFEQDYRGYMATYGLTSLWSIPAEVLLRGRALNGFLGPLWICAPLALLGLRDRRTRGLLIAAVVFGALYFTNIGTRFLIPVLPFLAVALASVFARKPVLIAVFVVAHGLSSWPDLAKLYADPFAWRLDRIYWKQALRVETEDGFLRRRLQNYAAARLIEDKVPEGEAVLAFDQEAEAYTTREIRTWYQSTTNAALGDLLHAPLMDEAKPRRRVEFRIPAVETTQVRILQTAADPVSQWYVNEVRLFSNGKELPRAPAWRLTASSNAWSIQDAFDGDPLTRWVSGERLRPGMWIEITLPRTKLDRIVMESGESEGASLPTVDIEGDVLRRSALQPTTYTAPVPLRLRRIATRAIARHGVHWILMPNTSFGADDYFSNRAAWGLDYVGTASGRKLYRIMD